MKKKDKNRMPENIQVLIFQAPFKVLELVTAVVNSVL